MLVGIVCVIWFFVDSRSDAPPWWKREIWKHQVNKSRCTEEELFIVWAWLCIEPGCVLKVRQWVGGSKDGWNRTHYPQTVNVWKQLRREARLWSPFLWSSTSSGEKQDSQRPLPPSLNWHRAETSLHLFCVFDCYFGKFRLSSRLCFSPLNLSYTLMTSVAMVWSKAYKESAHAIMRGCFFSAKLYQQILGWTNTLCKSKFKTKSIDTS